MKNAIWMTGSNKRLPPQNYRTTARSQNNHIIEQRLGHEITTQPKNTNKRYARPSTSGPKDLKGTFRYPLTLLGPCSRRKKPPLTPPSSPPLAVKTDGRTPRFQPDGLPKQRQQPPHVGAKRADEYVCLGALVQVRERVHEAPVRLG